MTRRLCLAAFLMGLPLFAVADQYWITYEGNDFPENEGWTRSYGGGGAERWIENGVFVLDSLRDHAIYDYYRVDRLIDPDPGELFVAEWRVRIVETPDWRDAGVVIARDDEGTLAFRYYTDRILSTREGWSEPITPLVFHTYRVESWDMLQYSLSIDGQLVRNGQWDLDSLNHSYVTFGDGTQYGGATSLTEWDYFRFGVVPETDSLYSAALCGLVLLRRRH